MATGAGQQGANGISRRSLLRGGLLAGVGVATAGAASAAFTATATAAIPDPQPGWAYCTACTNMTWYASGHTGSNLCAGNGNGPHLYRSGFYNYSIYNNEQGWTGSTNPQAGWNWCHFCQSLFWGMANSVCYNQPRGIGGYNNHDTGAVNYNLNYGLSGPNPQPWWRWCTQCHTLFWPGSSTRNGGACPAWANDSNYYSYHTGGTWNYNAFWFSTWNL
jgi:hypothetical protein